MIWLLFAVSLLLAAILLGTGMLISACLVGRALNQTHNLSGLDFEINEVNKPLARSATLQTAAMQPKAPWTSAVVVR